MKIPRITGTSPTAPRDSFTPYVFGATLGTPSRGRPEKVLDRLRQLGVIAPDAVNPPAPRSRQERERSEAAELARRDAERCAECDALRPNHLVDCGLIPMPDPAAKRCGCGYVKGSLGCRLTHGGAA